MRRFTNAQNAPGRHAIVPIEVIKKPPLLVIVKIAMELWNFYGNFKFLTETITTFVLISPSVTFSVTTVVSISLFCYYGRLSQNNIYIYIYIYIYIRYNYLCICIQLKNFILSECISHVSFVDCPGHDILMATMLNGAAVMDAALLLIAGNESCPQPQTSEHLAAIEIMRLKHIIILQNKIDLIKEQQAAEQYQSILQFVEGKT